MAFDAILIAALSALIIGVVLGWLIFRTQVALVEARYRSELERWKLEAVKDIRKDSVNRSRFTLKGKIAEQMAPLLPAFEHQPADARFIGSPVDYVIFDGLSGVADEKGSAIRIVFMDVKHGGASLSRTQQVIKKAVEEGKVSWETLRIPDT